MDFGEENEVLWAVIQHSSLELQQKYLPKFIAAAHKGKIRGELIAVMEDRIACWSASCNYMDLKEILIKMEYLYQLPYLNLKMLIRVEPQWECVHYKNTSI